MKQPTANTGNRYQLSTSNKVLIGIIALVMIVATAVFSHADPARLGQAFGLLLAMIGVPALFGWIVWRLSGKKQGSGSWTFNIVLTLLVFGQVGQFANHARQSQVLRDLEQEKTVFKATAGNTDASDQDHSNTINAAKHYQAAVKDGLHTLTETSAGQEKRFFAALEELVAEGQAVSQQWQSALDTVQAPRILDLSLMTNSVELDYQQQTITRYIEQTQRFLAFNQNALTSLKQRVGDTASYSAKTRSVMTGAIDSSQARLAITIPLIQAYLSYGQDMLALVDLLRTQQGKWRYEHEQARFENQEAIDRFNEIFAAISADEATINELSKKAASAL